MKKLLATGLLLASFSSQAALISVLGGQGVYDDVADLTWLQDANYAQTSGFDADGRMTWVDANSWAAGLDVDGVTGWRLADTLQPDATCSNQTTSGGFDVSFGFNCTGSELGNLFYNVLGGVAGSSIVSTHNANYDLFSNVQSNGYWSATEYAPNTSFAWLFNTRDGSQARDDKTFSFYTWAVQSGNVDLIGGGSGASVPVPAGIWLLGLGLLGLRRFKR